MAPRRPCINCGAVVTTTRCKGCESVRNIARHAARPHYAGDYRKRAAEVRASAVTCWLCGGAARSGDPWTADHVRSGDPDSPLLPAHRSCNSSRGGRTRYT